MLRMFRRSRGFLLLDILAGTFLLVILVGAFVALHTASIRSGKTGEDYSRAIAIAQRELENLRLVGYDNLSDGHLLDLGLIDPEPTESPYSFKNVVLDDGTRFSAATALNKGDGTCQIWDVSNRVRGVRIIVSWKTKEGNGRSIVLSSAVGKY